MHVFESLLKTKRQFYNELVHPIAHQFTQHPLLIPKPQVARTNGQEGIAGIERIRKGATGKEGMVIAR